jgi:excisionase family DNA binding protein
VGDLLDIRALAAALAALPAEDLAPLVERLGAELTPGANRPAPYLTVAEAAAYLGCERQRVYNLQSAGRLPRVKEGGRTLIPRAALEAHLKDGRP